VVMPPSYVLYSIGMAKTAFDAYRIGDILGPGVHAFIPGSQVPVKQVNGVDVVPGPGHGGLSMCLQPRTLKDPTSRWWFLPSGSAHPDTINLVKDSKNHSSWEPLNDMPLADYKSDLWQIVGWQIQ
jgi:hypothetical protein